MPHLLAVNHYRKNLRGNKLRFLFTILRAFAKYFKILYCGFSFGLGHILSTICSYHLLGYDDIPNMGIGSQQTKNDMHCLKCLFSKQEIQNRGLIICILCYHKRCAVRSVPFTALT
ncbi:hypothetical protein ACJX0J_040355 [Zea mays]